MDRDLQAQQEVRDVCRRAVEAQRQFAGAPQEQVDQVCAAMAQAGFRAARRLAELAVSDTGMGKAADKVIKDEFSTRDLWESIRDMATVGEIGRDRRHKVTVLAEPMGVVAGIIPTTNPTSTVMYKALIAVKSRNALVASPHPNAGQCTLEAVNVLAQAAVGAGAPEGLVASLTMPSKESAQALMRHPGVSIILSTGGKAIVRQAHSSGKPAYGVGPGNVPAFIERSADVRKAVRDIILGKAFDHGLTCSAENAMIVERTIERRVLDALKDEAVSWVAGRELELLQSFMVRPDGSLNTAVVGQSAHRIAGMAGFQVPEDMAVLLVKQSGVGREHPLSREKLSPVLAYYTVASAEAGIALAAEIADFGGVGHTAVIHSTNEELVTRFAQRVRTFRVLVNTPSPHGSVGYSTGLAPAMTLGSGTWGGSITGDNITPLHLLNRKRVAWETESVGPAGVKVTGASRRGSYSRYDDEQLPASARVADEEQSDSGQGLDFQEIDRIAESFSQSIQRQEVR